MTRGGERPPRAKSENARMVTITADGTPLCLHVRSLSHRFCGGLWVLWRQGFALAAWGEWTARGRNCLSAGT